MEVAMTAKTAILLAAVLTLAMVRPAAAVDGVIEINQARALAGGVTASDTAGFPVTIDVSGSYRLTGNLTVPDANTTAISVTTAAAVDIDLNGFAILGPTTCTAPPTVTCSPIGSGRGIERFGTDTSRLRVTHGVVRGMGQVGILADGALVVEDLEVMFNQQGIGGGDGSQVTGCEASRNRFSGIIVGNNSTVHNCVARYNGSLAIIAGDGAVVEHNQAISNVGIGIDVGAGSVVTGNTSLSNTTIGIVAGAGSTVVENTARNNTQYGLDLGGGTVDYGYARNVLTGNNGGDANPQSLGGIEIGTNICGTDTVCP